MFEVNLSPGMSVQAALDALPERGPVLVRLAAGRYAEKIAIRRDDVSVVGAGVSTILRHDDCAEAIHPDGRPYNTFRTAAVTVVGDGVTLADLTIENGAGSGPGIGQAVALAVYGTGFEMEDCVLRARQDTLFCGPLPYDLTLRYRDFLPDELLHTRPSVQRYRRCRIEGTVDFVFGSAAAFFEDCEIVCVGPGYVAAPSTPADQEWGLVFVRCRFRNVSGDADVALGRPWREAGMAGFLDCRFEGPFSPDRFRDWQKPRFRFLESPTVESPLSRAFGEEETERLESRLSEPFGRSGRKWRIQNPK